MVGKALLLGHQALGARMEPEVQGIRPFQQGLPSVKEKASTRDFEDT